VHRWVILLAKFASALQSPQTRTPMRPIKVRGQWMYLDHAVDSVGDTVEFFFSKSRDLPAAKRFFRKALQRHGRPHHVVIDGSQTNREAIVSGDATRRLQNRSRRQLEPITNRSSKYLNNRTEQDHRRIKRGVRSMPGLKSEATAGPYLGRHRDDPHDAQATGEACLKSQSVHRRQFTILAA
jgi:putative transposase